MSERKESRWQVRILNGPLRGVTYAIRGRVSIGRASSSDIQLVHDGISRQHAQIVGDDQGRHLLVDLDSSNGTFIDGERIRRHVLEPDTAFKIMRVKLVYEQMTADEVDCDESGVFAIRKIDRETLRGTIDYGELDLPQPVGNRPEARASSDAPRPRQAPASAPAVQARDEERHRVVATKPDGTIYPGSLIDDVVELRKLRIRISRGEQITVTENQRYEQLERQLGGVDDVDSQGRRTYYRFQCNFPAKLRFADGSEISTAVLDMGVDGARLRAYDHHIEHDAIVWLAVHLVARGRALTVVFTSRVIWTRRDYIGLGFAGTPDWENRGHRKLEIRTHMDLGEQVRAARSAIGRIKLRNRRPPS